MKSWFFRCVPVVVVFTLAACGGQGGSSVPPPTNVQATGGDSYIQVSWDVTAGVDYFVFSATDPALTTLNWLNLNGSAAYVNVTSPLTLCAQSNGQQRWFTVNGRTGAAPGGAGSVVVSATPRSAGDTWNGGATLASSLAGIGFGGMTTCKRAGLPTGVLTAVGPGATLYSSTDAVNWTLRTPPAGFTTDLYAVANYTATPDSATSEFGMRTIAVGAGGAALVSTDGSTTWSVGQAFDPSRGTLRAIRSVGSAFVAVGDGGTIRSTTDGTTWNTLNSNTATNLNGIAYGNGRYVAVGDSGTILISTDAGVTWSVQTIAGAGNLRAVAYGNNNNSIDNGGVVLINTFVAVGDSGTAVVSNDGGATWTVKLVAGAGDLAAIAYTSRFVAVDRTGNAFASANGQAWSNPITSGRTGLRAVAINGYGFIAVGDGGVTTSSF
ncbi:MAG: WD40/YVTN/BNR-like repeat-containing protein [Gemmatimonadota bacterium]